MAVRPDHRSARVGLEAEVVWARALELIDVHASGGFEVPVRDDDPALTELVEGSGLVAGELSSIAWMDAADRPSDGRVVGYSLYWFDPVTKVGLVEPVRVEDGHQRRGLARAMLTAGIDRLAMKGAQRVKIGYGTEAAAGLYQDVGFQPTSTGIWYEEGERST